MSSSKIQLRLPEDMREAATRQAALSGVSMNLFVATAVAARRAGRSGTVFSARATRTTPARAKALLERIGTRGQIRDDDRLDVPEN